MSDQQIEGLPEGATVRPMQPQQAATDPSQIEGLPEGATVRPLAPPAPKSSAPAGPTATELHDQGIVNKVKSYAGGLAESVGLPTSLKEAEQQGKAASEANPSDIASAIGGPAVGMAKYGYDLGKKYLKDIVGAGKEAYEAGQNIGKGQPVIPNLAKPAAALVEANVGAVPFIGEPTVKAGEAVAAGNVPRAAGLLTGVVGQVVAPEVMDRALPEQNIEFHEKKVAAAQKAVDTAKKAAEPYRESMAQGILPPEDIQKPIDKAQKVLDEATAHRDIAKEAVTARRTNVVNPKPAPEVPTEEIAAQPALGRLGENKPRLPQLGEPQTPPTVSPAHAATTIPQEPIPAPRPSYGRIALPNEQGTMGTPKLLTEGTPEQAPKGGMPQMKLPEEAPKSGMPQMTDEAALRALEAKEGKVVTNPKKLVGEQLKEALKPGEAPKTNEPTAPKASEPAAPKAKEVAEAPVEKPAGTHDEKGVRREPANVRKPGEELSPEAQAVQHKALESISSLSNDRLDTMAREMGIDPSDPIYSRAKEMRGASREQTGRIRQANAILERMGSDEINKAAAKADQINGDAASANWARAKRADAVFEERLSGAPEGGYGAKNTGVTKEAYEAARKRAQEKLGGTLGMSGGNLPLSDWAIQARYHVEAGARSFADFSEKMLAEVGEAVRPHLQALFEQANGKAVLENAKEATETTPKLTNTEAAVAETEKQTPLSRSIDKTIRDIEDKFPVNPDKPGAGTEPKELAVLNKEGKPEATFTVSERAGNLRLKGIQSLNPGTGAGSRALKALTDIADKNHVTMELTASPYGDETTRLNSDQLKEWYSRHGFVPEEGHDPSLGYMVRNPEERREEERKAPLNAKETEEAMAKRKPFQNAFDVTEGAKETIAKDKNMPRHPAEETAKPTFDMFKDADGKPDRLEITHKGEPMGHLKIEEQVPGTWTIKDAAVKPGAQRQGFGKAALEQTIKEAKDAGAKAIESDVSQSTKANAMWSAVQREHPEAVTEENGQYSLKLSKLGKKSPYGNVR